MKQFIKAIIPKPLWTWLRVTRIRLTFATYRRRRVRHNYGGHALELELVDPMGADWYDHDWPELPEIAFLKQHRLRTGANVFDIGAHQCIVAMMLARAVGAKGKVLAVEANPDNCAAGEQNRKLNEVDNCKILHAAVAAESGVLIFNRGQDGQVDDGTGQWGRMEVKAVTIDELAQEHGPPDVLFIDVEGFECKVLEGARLTIAGRPDCFVEVHIGVGLEQFGGSVEEILAQFTEGYEFFMAPPGAAFIPLQKDSAVLRDRFFLLAIHTQVGG